MQFGVGMFQLVLSLLPPTVMKVRAQALQPAHAAPLPISAGTHLCFFSLLSCACAVFL
jgi:hypothetical protein